MNRPDLIARWSQRLGLASTPMFGHPANEEAKHAVLLDGGRGSFALSLGNDTIDTFEPNWIWSANLPHHVVIKGENAEVGRWDTRDSKLLSLDEIESRLEDFYRFLFLDRVKSRLTVVEHCIALFRRLRSVLHSEGYPENLAIELFLIQLAAMSSDEGIDSLLSPQGCSTLST